MKEIYGAVILAGGKSERMDFPKLFLELSGKSFLQKITEAYYNSGIKNICLVINKEFSEGVWKEKIDKVQHLIPTIIKTDPDLGRFHSIKSGLDMLSSCDHVFIQNADSPFVDKEIIQCLQKNRCSIGYTQLFHEGRKGHPILISQKIIRQIIITPGYEHDLRNILMDYPKTDVEINDRRILANINTKEDYREFILSEA